jgi:hypothetical protein
MPRWKVVETDKDSAAINGIFDYLPDKSGRVRALRQWSCAASTLPEVIISHGFPATEFMSFPSTFGKERG